MLKEGSMTLVSLNSELPYAICKQTHLYRMKTVWVEVILGGDGIGKT